MAEFVERELEELIPVFEQLQNTQLLSAKEVNSLVKQCRRYDYRLNKNHKIADDYLHYAAFLRDFLSLVSERRNAYGYDYKRDQIEGKLRHKTAFVYHRLCERFRGKMEYWHEYLQFLISNHMNTHASKAYIHAIQMHPHSIELRVAAAKFELMKHGSIENARRGLQMALRMHPESIPLWEALFFVEINYVKRLQRRRDLLTGKNRKKKEEDEELDCENLVEPDAASQDAVMQLKLAEIVMNQAINSFSLGDQKSLLIDVMLRLWAVARAGGEKCTRLCTDLEARMEEHGEDVQWQARILMRKDAGESITEVLDETDWSTATTDQLRFAIICCQGAPDDVVAQSRARGYVERVCERGEASEEEMESLLTHRQHNEKVAKIGVEKFPRNALFWRCWLAGEKKRLDDEQGTVDQEKVAALAQSINNAIRKTSLSSDFSSVTDIYKLAIDLAIQFTPKTVDKVWASSLSSSTGRVSGELKILRVDYLVSLHADDSLTTDQLVKHIEETIENRPNTVAVYLHVVECLLELTPRPTDFITKCLDFAVAEHPEDVDAWMAKCEMEMETNAIKVVDSHRRALLSLKDEAAESFISRYTTMQQRVAADLLKKKKRVV